MADKSAIEWTEATWNPVTGCSKVSPGCAHCYAERLAPKVFAGQRVFDPPEDDVIVCRPRVFTDVRTHDYRLDQPLRWRRPRRIFVNSMSDLFHEDIPDAFIERVFSVMALAERHTFQVLTKRPERMRAWFAVRRFDVKGSAILQTESGECHYAFPWPLPNVWLGVSVETQLWAETRIPDLLRTPAAVRFISAEPLLGPVFVKHWLPLTPPHPTLPRLDWLIVGGESGPGARAMHPEWARSVRDQCQAAGVPFFFKQWGEWIPISQLPHDSADLYRHYTPSAKHPDGRQVCKVATKILQVDGRVAFDFPAGAMQIFRVGKKAAGRRLDGREWNEFPTAVVLPPQVPA